MDTIESVGANIDALEELCEKLAADNDEMSNQIVVNQSTIKEVTRTLDSLREYRESLRKCVNCRHHRGAHFREGCDGDLGKPCPCQHFVEPASISRGPKSERR